MEADTAEIASQFQTGMCPICNGAPDPLFQKGGHWILECEECGHRFTNVKKSEGHVKRVYGADYFAGEGVGYPNYLGDRELRISQGRRYARLMNRYMQPGTIFDVGAAAGFILKGFEDEGWSGEGVEPNPEMAEHARNNLELVVETGILEQLEPSKQYDVVSFIQVIAHFIDPQRALRVAKDIVKPGGYWLFETWDKDSWTARILGNSWHEYSPPSVLHWFSPDTLSELVGQFGLEEIALGRTMKWIRPAHARSIGQHELNKTLAGKLVSVAAGLIPERMSLPYFADDLIWALYKSPGSAEPN